MHAKLAQDLLRIGQNVHQVRNRGALVSADIADAVFEQGLGDGKDALARKGFTLAFLQFLYFLGE